MKDLYQKRIALTQELRNMLDSWQAKTEISSNEFDAKANGEYQERCKKIEADLDALDARIASEERYTKVQKENDTPVYDSRGLSNGSVGDRKEDWGRRFIAALTKGDNRELNILQSKNFDGSPISERTMTVGTVNNDVAAIPVNFDEVIRQKLYMENVIRRIAKVTRIDGQKRITIEAALPTTELVAENTAMSSPSDPTFGTLIDVFPYKFQTKVVLSNEFLEDALSGNGGVGGIMDYVAGKVATSMSRSHENYFCNGTNSSQPQGIGTTQFVVAANTLNANSVIRLAAVNTAATAITADNIIDCFFACGPQYRANGSWVMSDTVLKTIRKLRTGSGTGDYLWKLDRTGDLREGVLGELMGRPLFVSPFYNTSAAANKPFVTFGDFNFFEIFDRSGITMLTDPYTSAANAVTNMYAYSRMDSKVTQTEAFSLIADAAA